MRVLFFRINIDCGCFSESILFISGSGMGWVGLGLGLCWVGLGWVGSGGWVGLGWVGLGLIGVGWVGLDWIGSDCVWLGGRIVFGWVGRQMCMVSEIVTGLQERNCDGNKLSGGLYFHNRY
jgi:hypothetical protein